MGLVARLEEVDAELFGDIGLLKCEPVRIQLDSNAEPCCINTARRMPFPLMPQVEEGLKRMEEARVIDGHRDQRSGAHPWYRYRKVMVSSGSALI